MEENFRKEEMLFMIKKICLNMTAQMDRRMKNGEMTGIQAYFLVYILRHHPEGTYLTELCREIGVSKATLSALIKKLREKDYLYNQEDPDDVRKKKVLPTAKLIAEGDGFLQKAEKMESQLCGALDPEEQRRLWDLEKKLISRSAAGEDREKERQEVNNREKSITAARTV